MNDHIHSSILEVPIDILKGQEHKHEIIRDYWVCIVSRECSLLGRKEVLTGKAKFGILGDGKEVPQVAMARAFKKGDWRSGYYRDQTFMMALGLCSVADFFAQLYADVQNDPYSAGRQMNAHFMVPTIDDQGEWLAHVDQYNVSSDISSTGGQMARALGIALASKKYRTIDDVQALSDLSSNGDEVSFVTIGDASTSEGVFWETVNAAAVMQVPLAISVWDDGYGISVPKELQTAQGSISEALSGFVGDGGGTGVDIYTCKAWDYPALVEMYERGIKRVRRAHRPALFHVEECTQPQGHSTSGSHERYKSEERLTWESDNDCIELMGEWMIANDIISREALEDLGQQAKDYVRDQKKAAWSRFIDPQKEIQQKLNAIIDQLSEDQKSVLTDILKDWKLHREPLWHESLEMGEKVRSYLMAGGFQIPEELIAFISSYRVRGAEEYNTHLYSDSAKSALKVPIVPATYDDDAALIPGHQILNRFFDQLFERDKKTIAFGEDVGQIGDVNQGFAGLQERYGKQRVFDTGIREWTIMGQAIGLAMRGLRPIAEIQYLDYLIYGIEPLSDDLATLRYRSAGHQHAPAIIRTRGHRLEGIWHAGSPMGMIINAMRGMYVAVPRNMTQAVGIYNTLMQSDDPALVVECLNGYRLREKLPNNLEDFTVPLGVPEILQSGTDLTLVTYGSCVREAEKACELLAAQGISVELIDVQTLLPFDTEGVIVQSLKRTNKLFIVDEDVPGGASAFMLKEILETQGGFEWLDARPVTCTAKDHRTPFGSIGDYFTKPGQIDIFNAAYKMMRDYNPKAYPYVLE